MDGLVKVYFFDPIIMDFSGSVICISYLGKNYEIKKPEDVGGILILHAEVADLGWMA